MHGSFLLYLLDYIVANFGTSAQLDATCVYSSIYHRHNIVLYRTDNARRNDKQASTSMNLPEATLQAGVEPPTYQEAINIETPSMQHIQTLNLDSSQPPPYTLDSTDTTN